MYQPNERGRGGSIAGGRRLAGIPVSRDGRVPGKQALLRPRKPRLFADMSDVVFDELRSDAERVFVVKRAVREKEARDAFLRVELV